MTSKQKAKGYYYETKTVDILNSIPGCHAKRQLASGAYGKLDERLDGDVILTINDIAKQTGYIEVRRDKDYKVEVKARTKDFPEWIEKALTQGDIVALWKCANGGSKGYILMPIETFAEVVG
jgi:hypothetical protein